MVKIFDFDEADEFKGFNRRGVRKKNQDVNEEEEEKDDKKYLDIWNSTNPSYKDISNENVIPQTLFIFGITLGVIVSLYIVTQHLVLSVGIGLSFCIVFIFIFQDEIYYLRYFFQFFFRSKTIFNPFEELIFWQKENDPATLYMSNRKDSIHVALRIYSIKIIPENVQPAIYTFIRSLATAKTRIPYSYQIVQKPLIHLFKKNQPHTSNLKSIQSRKTTILFSVFEVSKGVLTDHKLGNMEYNIKNYSRTLKSNLVSNFHHFRAVLLEGDVLINTVRTFHSHDEIPKYKTPVDKRKALHNKESHIKLKFGVFVSLELYVIFFLFYIGVFFSYIILVNIGLFIGLVLLWWRSLLFQVSFSKLCNNDDIIVVSPFENVNFYRTRKYPYTLFFHVDNQLLVGMKLLNLKYTYRQKDPKLEKFIESLNNANVDFSYTFKNKPLSFKEFYDAGGIKNLNELSYKLLLRYTSTQREKAQDEEIWLYSRAGMWLTILTMSVNSYKFVDTLYEEVFDEMEEELLSKFNALEGALGLNLRYFDLQTMKTSTLISGYLFSVLKYNSYRLNGSHLNHIMIQGANLVPIAQVAPVLRRGLTLEIAAEFNTPMYLDNYITIGHTYNTEVWEKEALFGFSKEQLQNLLIMNGTSEQRELLAMKTVSELIKAKESALVFDFNGSWSRLLTYFQESEFQKNILYFKYGSSFIIDPIKSDIPYDQSNTEYLEYVYDAFGLALKHDERMVEMFRYTIQKNPDMDLAAIQMALQNQNEWEKSPANELILQIFADFTTQEMTYFQTLQKGGIKASDFVKDRKTVIVDLSIFRELRKKLFVTFVILSKIIHYIHSEGGYHPKFLYIPFIDNIFDYFFLDKRKTYDKIDIFLRPLVERNFGLICSVNQIHNLHNNALIYFNNFLTFRATFNRDIAVLLNVINLQELEGMGVYSNKRKQSYQVNFLKNLKENTILARREDVDQPFPAILDWKDIQESPIMPYSQIIQLMTAQGYDLQANEKKILEQAEETHFERDLGHYYIYIEQIIEFMDQLLTIDQIGNLYKDKLKRLLKEILYPKIKERTQDRKQIKTIVVNVLEKLITHRYLVEAHPRRAGGGDALRTSYSVGQQYHEALQDYYEVQGRKNRDFQVEVIEREHNAPDNLEDIFPEHNRRFIVREQNIMEALSRDFGNHFYALFKMNEYIERGDFSNAIKIQHGLVKKYLMEVCRHYYNTNAIVFNEFNSFLGMLSETKNFPFSKQELIDFIDQYQVINLEKNNLEVLAHEIYESISLFFKRIKSFIIREEDGN
jgi:hypothetical protein